MTRFYLALLLVCAASSLSCTAAKDETPDNFRQETTVRYTADTRTNLKNPYMGWTLYSDGATLTDRPAVYWELLNEASQYAGVFYLRWRWSDLEPEEGKYAWEYNEDFKGMIQGALDRGLRLAFRIYVNGRDNLYPGTPQYVLDGAQTYTVEPGHQTPYADDEFFLEKYTKFIEAFGKEFNDPSKVDYVDSYGLGWWGEEHHIVYADQSRRHQSHDRIVKAYEKAFDKVINVVNFGNRDDYENNVVYNELKFSPRRDGYASLWFPKYEQEQFVSHFPHAPLIAEACYWGSGSMSGIEDGKWASWGDYYKDVVDLALSTHANYLDLRTTVEARRYLDVAKPSVKKFLAEGGYRILPTEIRYSLTDGKLSLKHDWQNIGVGVLPNNNVHLRNKYKVMFALFGKDNNPVTKIVSDGIEVSELVGDRKISAEDVIDMKDLPAGEYRIGVGIINQLENDSKDISLAVRYVQKIRGEWLYVGTIQK